MPVRQIILYPDPILRAAASDADPCCEETAAVIRDLQDTLASHVGVGIAAPQIGISKRIIAIDGSRAKRPVPNHGPLVLINPAILSSEGSVAFREGCLSIPDMVARVSRADRVTVSALLPNGQPVTILSEGFEAVILQHEIDHLNGVLFIDRVHNARDIKIRTN